MKKVFKIITYNLKSTISLITFVNIIFIFIFIVISKSQYLESVTTLSEYIKFIFYGPNNLSDNMQELLNWSLYKFYFLYIIGNYIYNELKLRNIYTISRIGSKFKWLIFLLINILLISIFYYLIGMIIGVIYIVHLNIPITANDIFSILPMFFLIVLSNCLLSTIYLMFSLVSKNHSLSFILTIILLYSSLSLGSMFNIDKYLPLNRSILYKHYTLNLNFKVSYSYLIIVILISIYVLIKYILKNNLTDNTH